MEPVWAVESTCKPDLPAHSQPASNTQICVLAAVPVSARLAIQMDLDRLA
jgi:hypothetical protein